MWPVRSVPQPPQPHLENCLIKMSKKHDPARWPDDAHDIWVNKKDFESRIITSPETQCWEFRGARHRQGYKFIGVIRKSDNRYIMATAHRVSYRIYHGPITQPNINHTCHNCGCVNPAHIYQGTQLQNVHDTIRLGLMPRYRDRYKPRADRGGNQPPPPSRPAKKSRRKYKYSEEEISFLLSPTR